MNYSGIVPADTANGEGVRTSLFVSGCHFHCDGCFNKEVQDFTYGLPYTDDTEDKIIKLVSNPYISGLSLLGGDPLCQSNEDIIQLCSLCDKVHELGKNVWIWSGYTIEKVFSNTLENYAKQLLILKSDIYVDGQFKECLSSRVLKWKGSSNQRVIDVKATIAAHDIILKE